MATKNIKNMGNFTDSKYANGRRKSQLRKFGLKREVEIFLLMEKNMMNILKDQSCESIITSF